MTQAAATASRSGRLVIGGVTFGAASGRSDMAHGVFHWNELLTDDVQKAKDFYASAIGWQFEPMKMDSGQTYWVAKTGGHPVAGIMDKQGVTPPGAPAHWFAYLEVDDVERRVAEVERNGGKVIRPPFDIPEVGRTAIVADPTGAPIGWITPTPRAGRD